MTTYGLPLLWMVLLAELAGGVLRAPFLSWNEIRLCRALEVLRGWPLYPGRDALGPIIGTLHTPLSHVFFLPAAMVGDVTAGLLMGSSLAVLAVLAPLAWVFSRAGGPVRFAIASFLFTAFLIIQTPGSYNVLFMIHADAPAVGFATLAGGFLLGAGGLKISRYWLAGLACALSVATKQTMAPVILALALYLLLAEGVRPMLHFLGAAALGGAVLLAGMLTVWPARDVLFNIWTLASARPGKPGAPAILMAAYRSTRLDALPALLPLIFLGVGSWRRGVRQFAAGNRWLLFALCAVCVLPVSLKAMVTIGSDINHLGVVLYFVFVAAGLAIQQHVVDVENPSLQFGARLFLVVGILVSLAPGLAWVAWEGIRGVRANPSQMAADYDRRHPGQVYFPWNPAAGVRASGRLAHLDPALFDREAVGYGLTPRQLQSGLPKGFTRVALPPGERITSRSLRDVTAGWEVVADAELPGWTVLRRVEAK